MNIAVIGNNYFGNIITEKLKKYDKKNTYKFYDTNTKKIDKIKFVLNILHIDIVYSVSASVQGGGALNIATFFNKRIVQHFIGSDVLTAEQDFKKGNVSDKLIKSSTFLCEVEWIKDELKNISIDAAVVPIMAYKQEKKPKDFENLSVLTYMSKGKEEFYGVQDYIALAKNFPKITFKIAGIDSYEDLPHNVKCLGWIDMIEELQNTTVFIRNAEHDGVGFSVIEALSLGRIVLYNYKFPYVQSFSNRENLIAEFEKIKKTFDRGELELNFEAIEFVKQEFDEQKVISNLKEVLLNNRIDA
ncbi:MAG TPA: glycosyltransferase family 1 protein [Arcobacter sp.]|nr:glycosyltransferase family 1 protein [Arcobacter sp.]